MSADVTWGGGRRRPRGAAVPGPAQESVWDYPRPPRVERAREVVRVALGGVTLAESPRAWRVLETASPPVYYIPRQDMRVEHLEPSARRTSCEWKGRAHYWSVRVGERQVREAAWSYPEPKPGFEAIRDCLAFYAGKMDACFVGDRRVIPQAGDFYGGWVTPEIVGPFKGEPGTEFW